MREYLKTLRTDKIALRRFGITISLAATVVVTILFHNSLMPFIGLMCLVAIVALFSFRLPTLLKPLYYFWMSLAFVLQWIATHIILTIMFYLILTPIGVIIRIFGGDSLKTKIDKGTKSYWVKRQPSKFSQRRYEQQF